MPPRRLSRSIRAEAEAVSEAEAEAEAGKSDARRGAVKGSAEQCNTVRAARKEGTAASAASLRFKWWLLFSESFLSLTHSHTHSLAHRMRLVECGHSTRALLDSALL